ncbi:hypothetical protein GCM10010919_02780 [Alishewanella longhuensis]|uniref:Uncharacterized protein n=1 Tax=Alishewanella longhuensis TaxID=1091037 RepID=A0ABQ3KTZ4_9ALTE|nr:hypothetical protein [Alishewanella longhuensis]GHG59870.1 hypothetical protein GCM10010919_02780 [Alishewanella longhuensis]
MNLAFGKQAVFVRNLEQLLAHFYHPHHVCYYAMAQEFFNQQQQQQQALDLAEQSWQKAQHEHAKAELLQKARKTFTDLQYEDEKHRVERWTALRQLAENLLQLSEGLQPSETLTLSARLFGSLLITALGKKRKTALLEYAYKPCYRALLTLRLLDDLLQHNIIKEPQWRLWHQQRNFNEPENCPYRQQLQLPLVMACIIQHIGQLNLNAQSILAKQDSANQTERALSAAEREQYLAFSQQGCIDFLRFGLGDLPYRGNHREQRAQHQQQQQQLVALLNRFITAPANTLIGSLFKVPQAYTSVILPGRSRYNYDALPKAPLLLREAVRRTEYDGRLVDRIFRILGLFPQGYGVVYTPLGDDGKPQLRYEFAIVNSLYPEKPEQPGCRVVSRNQHYRNTGYNIHLSTELNLYFKPARDRLKTLPEKRLRELLNVLYQDGDAQYARKLLPHCWQPDNFFSLAENQNLWHSAEQRQN